MKRISATAFAPATTGNVGVGFDILGVALDTLGDTVTVTKTRDVGFVEILGRRQEGIPFDPDRNTATAGLIKLIEDLNLDMGFKVRIKKGIPLGSGMGGSASSAVAGVFAANALLPKPLKRDQLLKYALIGEAVASGSAHGDNVAPCLFGGLTLIVPRERTATEFLTHELFAHCIVPLPFPSTLVMVVALPHQRLDTKDAREVLSTRLELKSHVRQSGHLAGFIAGCYRNDVELIRESFRDLVIEPQRAHLITGFKEVKAAALKAGALGCTISGAGPAVFAITAKSHAGRVKAAMVKAFNAAGAGPTRSWISPVNKKGVHLI